MRWVFRIFIALYAIALLMLAVGTFGWFEQDRDPLSAVLLLPLGLPWNILADRAGIAGTAALIAAPAINAAIIWWFSYRRAKARAG